MIGMQTYSADFFFRYMNICVTATGFLAHRITVFQHFQVKPSIHPIFASESDALICLYCACFYHQSKTNIASDSIYSSFTRLAYRYNDFCYSYTYKLLLNLLIGFQEASAFFGVTRLKEYQKNTLNEVLDKKDMIVRAPTGSGKSFIFWVNSQKLQLSCLF